MCFISLDYLETSTLIIASNCSFWSSSFLVYISQPIILKCVRCLYNIWIGAKAKWYTSVTSVFLSFSTHPLGSKSSYLIFLHSIKWFLISLPFFSLPYYNLSQPFSSAYSWLSCFGVSVHCGRERYKHYCWVLVCLSLSPVCAIFVIDCMAKPHRYFVTWSKPFI